MRKTQKILPVYIVLVIASLFFMDGGYFWFQLGFITAFLIGNYYSLKSIFLMVFKTKYILIKDCFEEIKQEGDIPTYTDIIIDKDGNAKAIKVTRRMIMTVQRQKFDKVPLRKKLETMQFRDKESINEEILPIAVSYIDMIFMVKKYRKGLGENWSVYSITLNQYAGFPI